MRSQKNKTDRLKPTECSQDWSIERAPPSSTWKCHAYCDIAQARQGVTTSITQQQPVEQLLNAAVTRAGILVNSSPAMKYEFKYLQHRWNTFAINWTKQRNSNEQSPFSRQVVSWTTGKTDLIASGTEGVTRIKDLWVLCLWWIWDDGIWTVQAGSESRIILWLLIAIVSEHGDLSIEEPFALLLKGSTAVNQAFKCMSLALEHNQGAMRMMGTSNWILLAMQKKYFEFVNQYHSIKT